jgi:hypothetical protein
MLLAVDGKLFNGLWATLKCIYGLVPIVLGLDKFFYYIVNWNIYVSPFVAAHIPVTIPHFVMIVGIIEIIAGLIVLSHWTRFGAYIVALWILLIIINLFAIGGLMDIILRDLVIAVGYVAYAILTQIKETARPA